MDGWNFRHLISLMFGNSVFSRNRGPRGPHLSDWSGSGFSLHSQRLDLQVQTGDLRCHMTYSQFVQASIRPDHVQEKKHFNKVGGDSSCDCRSWNRSRFYRRTDRKRRKSREWTKIKPALVFKVVLQGLHDGDLEVLERLACLAEWFLREFQASWVREDKDVIRDCKRVCVRQVSAVVSCFYLSGGQKVSSACKQQRR